MRKGIHQDIRYEKSLRRSETAKDRKKYVQGPIYVLQRPPPIDFSVFTGLPYGPNVYHTTSLDLNKDDLGSQLKYAVSQLPPKDHFIQDFYVNHPEFSFGLHQTSSPSIAPTPFSELCNAVIGVEATAYLQNVIDGGLAHEPLLAALGGDPIGLNHHLGIELERWAENNMTPLFIFDGQSIVGKDDVTLRSSCAALLKTRQAWKMYEDNQPNDAVKAFGSSGAIRVNDLYHILQEVLDMRGLVYLIAPFSACAQLVYLLELEVSGKAFIDGLMGSKELLLYDRSPEAVVICPPNTDDWKNKHFRGIFRSELIEKLGVSSEMLDDALLMSGTSFLPTFPPLLMESIVPQQPFTLTDAISLLRTSEKSIVSVCAQFSDILDRCDPKWLDKFRKARIGILHAIIVQEDGQVISRDYANLMSDNNDYLGLRLPPELYHYLCKALVGPRILNYFISLESIVFPTLDGIVSEEYKRLVTKSLIPLKETSAALIASRIHRVFQNKPVTMRFWFDNDLKQTLVHKNILEQANRKADTWGVDDNQIDCWEKSTKTKSGSLSFAVLSLADDGAPAKSKSSAKIIGLRSKPEIISNTLYRFLHLRGYVNDQHELNGWGKALATTLKAVRPILENYDNIHHVEEAALLAYEMIRFNSLNSHNRHPELIGGPLRGTDEEKANCILIGRTACLLKLRHRNLGYTGPLSKNFLSYNSLIKAVQETDRDILEAIVASMFMSNQISRHERHNYADLGRSLPFSNYINTIFGIAVTTYLDDFVKLDWTKSEREANKLIFAKKFIPHSLKFSEDLEVGFNFFDAVYAGVKTLGNEIPLSEKEAWDQAHKYLCQRS
ncbi:hypothetical protein K3495_g9005 [Podosphaera aphanis]|nr:hypothetical protein K3495_g9005 [Podosphaera aphanis]